MTCNGSVDTEHTLQLQFQMSLQLQFKITVFNYSLQLQFTITVYDYSLQLQFTGTLSTDCCCYEMLISHLGLSVVVELGDASE